MSNEGYFSKLSRFQNSAPVDVVGIADAYGISIEYENGWSDGISGKLIKDKRDKYRIVVNGRHSRNRQRFTIAHEIAHFLLHRDDFDTELADDGLYRSHLSSKLEVQANKLAADILMPRKLLHNLIRVQGIKDLDQLSQKLQVSKHALMIRLGLPVTEGG